MVHLATNTVKHPGSETYEPSRDGVDFRVDGNDSKVF